MRRNALIALHALGSGLSARERMAPIDISAATDALAEATSDRDVLVRAWATDTLGMVGPALEHVAVFIRVLHDPSAGVRLSACAALGRLVKPIPAAIEALKHRLDDENSDVRTCVSGVLSKLGGD